MAKVLVIGGAGYVGSSTCAALIDQGHDVSVIDDFSTGHTQTLIAHRLLRSRIGDPTKVLSFLKTHSFDCVMHFAAKSIVSESIEKPDVYFENNVNQTRALLEMMIKTGTRNIVFSSTCAIFGDPGNQRIHESLPKNPIHPYGRSKLEAESLLQSFAKDHGLRAIALRYFNASGCEPKCRVGEWHDPESHLIPNALKAAIRGDAVSIFGTDYSTFDGTCVRDYVHVSDLAAAHESAMKRLIAAPNDTQGIFEAFHLGSETGYSVLQVLDEVEKITAKKINRNTQPRRAGDPPVLVADSSAAKSQLAFQTQKDSLRKIIQSAYEWELKRSQPQKAVFLDRDGTLNPDPGYISSPDQISLLPRVGESLKLLRNLGYRLIVVSNQSGVGRGLIHKDAIHKIHERLDEYLAEYGVQIDAYQLCFHRPEDHCKCRKPGTELIETIAKKENLDLGQCIFIGDRDTDIAAGKNSGCRASILLRSGDGRHTEKEIKNRPLEDPRPLPDVILDDLFEAANWIRLKEIESFSTGRD